MAMCVSLRIASHGLADSIFLLFIAYGRYVFFAWLETECPCLTLWD